MKRIILLLIVMIMLSIFTFALDITPTNDPQTQVQPDNSAVLIQQNTEIKAALSSLSQKVTDLSSQGVTQTWIANALNTNLVGQSDLMNQLESEMMVKQIIINVCSIGFLIGILLLMKAKKLI